MIISTKKGAPQAELDRIIDNFEHQGLSVTLIRGTDYNVFGLVGDTTKIAEKDVLANPWVENVTRVSAPYKRANRLFHPDDTVVDVNGIKIGGKSPIAVMAGPCSVEGEEHTLKMAKLVKAGGANFLRGGAYKPRTSPYSFQGLGTEGILDLVKAREATGLPIVSELMDEAHIDEFEEYVDIVQIGARNMQNFELLKDVGQDAQAHPAQAAVWPTPSRSGSCPPNTSWPAAMRTSSFANAASAPLRRATRNTLDLSAVPVIKEKTHLPIIVDPSHATGDYKYIESMALAAVAAGADGLEIEVHDNPQCAWSDGAQCLKPEKFAETIANCRKVAAAIGREM